MSDDEILTRFAEINSAIDKLFALHGMLSPRLAAMRPAHLRDPGVDIVQTIGGHQVTRP